jgi:cob(I)alamin adenosyltransferase
MPEPTDAVLPILQRIQSDLADARRSLEAKINNVAEMTLHNSEKLEAIEGYVTYQMGMTTQNQPTSKRSRKRSSASSNGLRRWSRRVERSEVLME